MAHLCCKTPQSINSQLNQTRKQRILINVMPYVCILPFYKLKYLSLPTQVDLPFMTVNVFGPNSCPASQRSELGGEVLWQLCLQQEEERAGAGDQTGLHIFGNAEICGEPPHQIATSSLRFNYNFVFVCPVRNCTRFFIYIYKTFVYVTLLKFFTCQIYLTWWQVLMLDPA